MTSKPLTPARLARRYLFNTRKANDRRDYGLPPRGSAQHPERAWDSLPGQRPERRDGITSSGSHAGDRQPGIAEHRIDVLVTLDPARRVVAAVVQLDHAQRRHRLRV